MKESWYLAFNEEVVLHTQTRNEEIILAPTIKS